MGAWLKHARLDELIDDEELLDLASRSVNPERTLDALADPGLYHIALVDGDLVVEGDLVPVAARVVGLVVTGDLIISGLFEDALDPWTVTLVFGDMRAGDVITAGTLEVHGDLSVGRHLIGDYNDYTATVLGTVHTRCFFPETHHFDVRGGLDFEMDYTALTNAAERLVPELVVSDEEGETHLDHAMLIHRVRNGLGALLAE